MRRTQAIECALQIGVSCFQRVKNRDIQPIWTAVYDLGMDHPQFAIQTYQPSPFYLLDEVDMFLDGLNAENVARAIKKNSTNAQFMQVSLRKTTLKEADHMIGVAKQPNGLSQVVIKANLSEEDLPDEPAPAEEAGSA